MPFEDELLSLIKQILDERDFRFYTSQPGRVESFDSSKGTATVQPVLEVFDSNRESQKLPKIPNVPVLFPRTGSISITWPIQQGDLVLLVFSQSPLGKWKKTSGQSSVPATSTRTHDITDAIAIPGLYPPNNNSVEHTDKVQIKAGSGEVLVGSDGTVALGNGDASIDLVSVLVTLVDYLKTARVDGGGALYPFTAATIATFESISAQLKAIQSGF